MMANPPRATSSALLAAERDEVLRVHQQAAVGRLAATLRHRMDLFAALLPASLGAEPLAGLQRRAVAGLHEDDVVLRRVEPPRIVAAGELELNAGAREQLAYVLLVTPKRGRRGVVRRSRHVPAHDLEELADLALGRPVDQADAPAGPADA